METENWMSTDSALPGSGGWRCRALQEFIVLMAHRPPDSGTTQSASDPAPTESGYSSLSKDVAQAFQMKTGYATTSLTSATTVDEKVRLSQFLAADGSPAAVLVMEAKVLGRVLPPCDWQTPLLRVRNRLADEGAKFFVTLTTRHEKRGVVEALARLSEYRVAIHIQRYCEREGIGFLGTIETSPPVSALRGKGPLHERVAKDIANRLASTAFFCCDAFRTSRTTFNMQSLTRG